MAPNSNLRLKFLIDNRIVKFNQSTWTVKYLDGKIVNKKFSAKKFQVTAFYGFLEQKCKKFIIDYSERSKKFSKKIMSLPPLFNRGFPNFYKEHFGNVDIYWYQSDFAQSRYPPGQETSEACTLICLLVAQTVGQLNLPLHDVNQNSNFNVIIAEAIIEGNSIHAYIVKNKLVSHPYLDTEKALKFGGTKLSTLKEWKFQVFHENLDVSLYKNMKLFLYEWYKYPKSPDLFMLLITCGRTILFIFQQYTKQVVLFDSHVHSSSRNPDRGLVVAQVPLASLEELCNWYAADVIHNCYELEADQYELACLYYQSNGRPNSCQKCKCSLVSRRSV